MAVLRIAFIVESQNYLTGYKYGWAYLSSLFISNNYNENNRGINSALKDLLLQRRSNGIINHNYIDHHQEI